MSRSLTTPVATAATSSTIYPALLVELDWPEGAVYVWSGLGNLSWNGKTWLGVGDLGSVSKVTESKDGKANGITLTLSGVPSSTIYQALQVDYQGSDARIYLGVMNSAGVFQADPTQIAYAKIDTCSINENADTATVSVNLEKEFVDTRSRGGRYTDQEQQAIYSGDTFFKFTAAMAGQNIYWGIAAPTTTTATPASSSSSRMPTYPH